MNDFVLKHFNFFRKCIFSTVTAGILCGLVVTLSRIYDATLMPVPFCNIAFPYTDAFIIFASAAYGFDCGMLAFTFVFISEVFRVEDYSALYALSVYLILVFVSSKLAYKNFFKTWKKTFLAALILTAVLAISWKITFTVIAANVDGLIYYPNLPYSRLIITALPESFTAAFLIFLFLRFSPEIETAADNYKNWNKLGVRVTELFILEALILCLIALVVDNIFSMSSGRVVASPEFISQWWRANLRLGLMMISAAIPIAFIFNLFIMKNVVQPINSMSLVMDKYFDTKEKDKTNSLPDLNIHTGDEVERLYLSLQKMVGDMSCYINQIVEEERRAANLTRGFMLALAEAVDAKDAYTNGHSVRVAKYSREIARRLGKSEKEQEEIFMMGLLHDIGKIGIPNAILNKPGKLTDEEFAKIKEHSVMGYEILRHVTELPALAAGARWHHERIDGRGYPDKLSGEAIPEEARIIALADSYDAMTSTRSYRSLMPQDKVREQIFEGKGTQFDSKFADVMIAMIDEDKEYKLHE